MRDHAAGATDSGRCNGQTVLGNHNIFRDKDKVKNTYKHAIHVTDYDDRTKNERERRKEKSKSRYFTIFYIYSIYVLAITLLSIIIDIDLFYRNLIRLHNPFIYEVFEYTLWRVYKIN